MIYPETYKLLADAYYTFYLNAKTFKLDDESLLKNACLSIFKLLNLKFEKGMMHDLTGFNIDYKPTFLKYKTAPQKLAYIDEEGLSAIANELSGEAYKLNPLLNVMGYVVTEDAERYLVTYVGTATSNYWKDVVYSLDLASNASFDWKNCQDDFADIDLKNIKWV